MENTGRIRQALHALQVGADDTHNQEMSMVREATNRLLKSNDEIIAEIENAIGLYAEGRWHIADKLAEAKALVGRLPAPRQYDPLPRFLNDQVTLPLDSDDPLKLYDRTEPSEG